MIQLDPLAVAVIAGVSALLVVGVIAALFARRITQRMMEDQRTVNARVLQKLRDALEAAALRHRRSSESLVQSCTDLWRHLADLRITSDLLWYHASREHLEAFVGALTKARVAGHRGRLILPDSQYARLETLFDQFEAIELGGTLRIMDLRSGGNFDEFLRPGTAYLQEQLRRNAHSKRQYESLTEEILRELKVLVDLPREDALPPKVIPLPLENRRAEGA